MVYILLVLAIVAVDRISKFLAIHYLKDLATYPLIDGIFHLTYAENTGAAFSAFTGKQVFLLGITTVTLALLVWLLIAELKNGGNTLYRIALTFVIGGAIGNFIDRIVYNYVIDYFDFRLINFAIFNVADSFIVVGAILLGYAILFTSVEVLK